MGVWPLSVSKLAAVHPGGAQEQSNTNDWVRSGAAGDDSVASSSWTKVEEKQSAGWFTLAKKTKQIGGVELILINELILKYTGVRKIMVTFKRDDGAKTKIKLN